MFQRESGNTHTSCSSSASRCTSNFSFSCATRHSLVISVSGGAFSAIRTCFQQRESFQIVSSWRQLSSHSKKTKKTAPFCEIKPRTQRHSTCRRCAWLHVDSGQICSRIPCHSFHKRAPSHRCVRSDDASSSFSTHKNATLRKQQHHTPQLNALLQPPMGQEYGRSSV